MDKDEALKPIRIDAFWSRIDRSGGPDACWPWSGKPVKTTGYGQCVAIPGLPCYPPRGITTPHRQAWIITNGDPGTHLTPKGLSTTNRVRHRCPGGPNKLCCNPAHLEIGTRGEQITIAKLTEERVVEALKAHAEGASCYSLAKKYGVSRATIASALHGETWTHVAPHIKRPPRAKPHQRRTP